MLDPLLTPMQLGRMLQTARRARKLSQTDVGARMNLSQKRISALELDPSAITVDQLLRMCAVLGLELGIGPKGATRSEASAKVEW